jgi:hypothetical protein
MRQEFMRQEFMRQTGLVLYDFPKVPVPSDA